MNVNQTETDRQVVGGFLTGIYGNGYHRDETLFLNETKDSGMV